MEMNITGLRSHAEPKMVLYQSDASDPTNPHGLLVAYAEATVKPVVSDFDTFLVGSTDMRYEPTPDKQVELIKWSLKHTEALLETLNAKSWTTRWLEVLKQEA